MRTALASLESTAPYSQSRPFEPEWQDGDTHDIIEKREWRNKAHLTEDGHVFIPPMSFIWGLQYAAQRMGRVMKGSKTFAKTFQNGVMCVERVILPITKDELRVERVYVNADGRRGSGTRVWRYFPMVDEWKAKVPFTVLADEIPNGLFEETLEYAGMFAGIGRFRPERGGYLGRFQVASVKWS